MLITQAARDTHAELSSRWEALEKWLTDSANADALNKVGPPIQVFWDHWREVDRGILSDSDAVCGAYPDLETAENYAIERGYPKPAKHGVFRPESCTVAVAQEFVGAAGTAAATYCESHPKDAVCAATAPQDGRAWCQRLGAPGTICDEHGLRDWFVYAVAGAGVAAVAAVAYAAFRTAEVAAPIALEVYAPDAAAALRRSRPVRVNALAVKLSPFKVQRGRLPNETIFSATTWDVRPSAEERRALDDLESTLKSEGVAVLARRTGDGGMHLMVEGEMEEYVRRGYEPLWVSASALVRRNVL